jgi:WD40 repeat protein
MKPFQAVILIGFLVGCTATTTPAGTAQPAELPSPSISAPSRMPSQQAVTASPSATLPPSLLPTIPPTQTITPFPTPLALESTPIPFHGQTIQVDNASQVVELARWGKGNANNLANSPDGSVLAVASSLGIYFYDMDQNLLDIIPTADSIDSLAFVPGTDLLAAGSQTGTIDFWDWRKKSLVKSIDTGTGDWIEDLTVSPQADLLGFNRYSASDYMRYLTVWRVADASVVFERKVDYGASFAFSPDFKELVVTGGTFMFPGIWVYDLSQADPNPKEMPLPYEGQAFAVAFSHQGRRIAVASDFDVYLWNLDDPSPYKSFTIESIASGRYSFSPACMINGDPGVTSIITALAFSPDDQVLAVSLDDGSTQFRRSSDAVQIASLSAPTGTQTAVKQILFRSTKNTVALLYSSGSIDVVQSQDAKLLGRVSEHIETFNTVAISPDDRSVAASASDNRVRIWNVASGQPAPDLESQADSLAFSPEGAFLAFGGADGSVHLWNLQTGKSAGIQKAHERSVDRLAFSPDGKALVSVSQDCSMRVWKVAGGLPLKTGLIYDPQKPWHPLPVVGSIALSPDGQWLGLVGSASTPIEVIPMADLENPVFLGSRSANAEQGIAFSLDGHDFAVVSQDGLSIWSLDDRTTRESWSIGGSRVVYSSDGKLLVVGDAGGKITVLNAENGEVLQMLSSHRAGITSLAFSQNGKFFASSSADGTVRVWGLP